MDLTPKMCQSNSAPVRLVVKNTFLEVGAEEDTSPGRRDRAFTDTSMEYSSGPRPAPMKTNCEETLIEEREESDSDVTTSAPESKSGSMDWTPASDAPGEAEAASGASSAPRAAGGAATALAPVPESLTSSSVEEEPSPVNAQASAPPAMLPAAAFYDDCAEADALEAKAAQLARSAEELRLQAQQARASAVVRRSVGRVSVASSSASGASPLSSAASPLFRQEMDSWFQARMSVSSAASAAKAPAAPVPAADDPPAVPAQAMAKTAGSDAARGDSSVAPNADCTSLVIRNLPDGYTRDLLAVELNNQGFAKAYNFVYFPTDFKNWAGFGYAIVNFFTHASAVAAMNRFQGFGGWPDQCDKVCDVVWSVPHQGFAAHVERYRNSPVMHAVVPDEVKPAIYGADGVRLAFPDPTKRIRAPRVRGSAVANTDADFKPSGEVHVEPSGTRRPRWASMSEKPN